MNGWQDIDRLWNSMDLLRNRMNRLFGDRDRSWLLLPDETAHNYPGTNLYDDADHFLIEAEVPGFAREELNIRIQGNYLELSGKRRSQVPEGYTSHRLERQATAFSRNFTLPADIDQDRVEAVLKNGILTLKLPKAESAKPRQIKIN
jgi:HSP20 family protein